MPLDLTGGCLSVRGWLILMLSANPGEDVVDGQSMGQRTITPADAV